MRGPARTSVRVALVSLSPVAVAAALVPVRTSTDNVNLALAMAIGVLGAGAWCGLPGGLVAAAVATPSFDLFLTRPYGSFRISAIDDVVATVLLAVVGCSAALLGDRIRRAAGTTRSLERLQRISELGTGAGSRSRLVRVACEELTALLDLKACRYCPGPAPADAVHFDHAAVRVPAVPLCHASTPVTIPVRHGGREVGHFVLVFPRSTVGLDVPGPTRRAASAVADLVGATHTEQGSS